MSMISATGGFEWPALMRLGIRGLGLKPAEFWALTPAELLLMLGAGSGTAPMGRARLEELARAFPDEHAGEGGLKGQDKGQHHG
ncbi:putative phage protein (TIGR02216 family) [Celeribacter persicus]|uniref:Putative phage protein (TIGR02216 family) n=2 Tax=Celeribacter persicus TaxID=1651082 RepID=A0A2T5HAE5_9RHOB|nr:rcc01693 family protein [Celeribacter persicus]PTQ68551.1 putative phage protein (TIGR02216 family) [Celeribacter persicus]